jgi:hypothetical protein
MPVLTDDQSTVLKALMVEGATPAERTETALRDRTGLPHVGGVLRELENNFDLPLVANDEDATSGTKFWWATPVVADL